MHEHVRSKQRISGWPRRCAAVLARHRYRFVSVIAVALAVAACVTLAPRGLSNAASTPGAAAADDPAPSTDGINWVPVSVSQNNDNGSCSVEIDGNVEGDDTTSTSDFAQVDADLPDLPAEASNQDGIGSVTVSEPSEQDSIDQPASATAPVDCSLITQADAYLKKAGLGTLSQAVQATLDAYTSSTPASAVLRTGLHALPAVPLAYDALPGWVKGAIANLAACAVYIAVSSLVMAAFVAFDIGTGGAATVAGAAVAAFAGCLGGLASNAVSTGILTGQFASTTTLSNAVTGCFTGGAVAVLPIAKLAPYVANSIRGYLGLPAVGATASASAVEAAVMGAQGQAADASGVAGGAMSQMLEAVETAIANVT